MTNPILMKNFLLVIPQAQVIPSKFINKNISSNNLFFQWKGIVSTKEFVFFFHFQQHLKENFLKTKFYYSFSSVLRRARLLTTLISNSLARKTISLLFLPPTE
jgi:hypothetical protein